MCLCFSFVFPSFLDFSFIFIFKKYFPLFFFCFFLFFNIVFLPGLFDVEVGPSFSGLGSALISRGEGWPFLLGLGVGQLCVVIIIIIIAII